MIDIDEFMFRDRTLKDFDLIRLILTLIRNGLAIPDAI